MEELPPSRVGLVAPKALDFGICRSFQGHVEFLGARGRIGVFNRQSDALSWLLRWS
jgi:hypothetical protein